MFKRNNIVYKVNIVKFVISLTSLVD